MVVLILGESEERILRCQLQFDLAVPFDPPQFVVRTHAFIALPVHVQRIAEPAECAEVRRRFVVLPIAARLGGRGKSEPVALEQAEVFLLRNVGRDGADTCRGQQVSQEQFVEPGSLVAEIEPGGVSKRIEAICQEKVGRVVGVVVGDRARRLPQAYFRHARLPICRGQTGAAHRAILVQEQFGAIQAPVVVELK